MRARAIGWKAALAAVVVGGLTVPALAGADLEVAHGEVAISVIENLVGCRHLFFSHNGHEEMPARIFNPGLLRVLGGLPTLS